MNSHMNILLGYAALGFVRSQNDQSNIELFEAEQSSVYGDVQDKWGADRVVKEVYDQSIVSDWMSSPPYPCIETETEQGPWWKALFVDNYFTVGSVKLLSRNIGDTSKLAGVDIYVSDTYCATTPMNPSSIQ